MKANAGLFVVSLTLAPFAWVLFYRIAKLCNLKLKQRREQRKFWERHNCVVTYNRRHLMTGWPGQLIREATLMDDEQRLLPILYFIDTAQKSIDLAIMTLNCPEIVEALIKAQKRGVMVRVILHYDQVNEDMLKKRKDAGICTRFYVPPNPQYKPIMHHKFAIKDCRYVCYGSLNWVSRTIVTNCENIVYTAHADTIRQFVNIFGELWDYLDESRQNYRVKSKLKYKY